MSEKANSDFIDDDIDEDDMIDLSDVEVQDKHIPTQKNAQTSEDVLRIEDLTKSGLDINDIETSRLDNTIKVSANIGASVKGYIIRYHKIDGSPQAFWRARLFDHEPKYKQVKNQPNHIYFPKNFMLNYKRMGRKIVILTEGEKKAALLAKKGFPACSVSGVDSWRNRYIQIPTQFDVIQNATKGYITYKVGDDGFDAELYKGTAIGFEELVNLLYADKSQLVICYDAEDPNRKAYNNIQRAAASLGFELRNRGIEITAIRQMFLPLLNPGEKIGVDDFIMHPEGGLKRFQDNLDKVLQMSNAFPAYPNIREYISKNLGKPRLSRKQYQQIGIALISDLDRRGKRMYSPYEDQMYYFNRGNSHLMKVHINDDMGSAINATEFGRLLYKEYDVSPTADRAVIQWLGTQLSAEDPVENVNPSRIISRPKGNEDVVRFQLNDGQFVKITGDKNKPFQILNNGDDNTLFVSEGTLPISGDELKDALKKTFTEELKPWWIDVFRQVKLKEEGNSAIIMALLYYISPWLYRWRGTQLPIEMVCGESGSGKSTLISLRQNILMGQASLKNAPSDLKDWYATISKSGGMHVIDNLHFTDKQLAQRMSDELCRLVTEPNPTIEQRKYFTNTDVIKVPVDAIFAFTAIKQPFNNADLIQRSLILELDKAKALNFSRETGSGEDIEVKDYAFDGTWMQQQIDRFGGRAAWVAHHLHVLHKFFALVEKKWQNNYKAKYRLINVEQALILMAEVFGMKSDWIPDHLATTTNKIISQSDWVLEGLRAFADYWRKCSHGGEKPFSAHEIAQFANSSEEYEDNNMLTNVRILGRYLQTAKYNIATIAGIIETKAIANKKMYALVKHKGNVTIVK